LDPNNKPNGVVDGFERDGDYVLGYRANHSIYMNNGPRYGYLTQHIYTAPVFSTSNSAGHPGLFIGPSIGSLFECVEDLVLEANVTERTKIIKVKSLAADIHCHFDERTVFEANERPFKSWRTREFEVIEEVGNWNQLFKEWKERK
jgi:hypothetical protein